MSRRHQRGDDRGYSVLEAAITLPAMIMLTMAIVQYALVWHARNVAQAAAQQALRTGEAYGSTAAAGKSDAESFLHQVAPHLLPNPDVAVNRSRTTVTVRIHASVISVVPFGSFTVDSSASGPVEIFVQSSNP